MRTSSVSPDRRLVYGAQSVMSVTQGIPPEALHPGPAPDLSSLPTLRLTTGLLRSEHKAVKIHLLQVRLLNQGQ